VFTSAQNKEIAERTGVADIIRGSGALLLENTCPEVVPYDQSWVKHVLTNSMKAEHYIQSGLNGIPTSVMTLADCVAVALGEARVDGEQGSKGVGERFDAPTPGPAVVPPPRPLVTGPFAANGRGLPSQGDFCVRAEAFVTHAPITFLGFVNRETAVVEEPGHPADGQSMAGKIAIFPKGSGSTVAPYVLLELFYRGQAPVAIVNTDIDQQSAPACSLEGIPYAYGFDGDIINQINHGDVVELRRREGKISLTVVTRRP
jgi:predicted aconitase with swiveling domain